MKNLPNMEQLSEQATNQNKKTPNKQQHWGWNSLLIRFWFLLAILFNVVQWTVMTVSSQMPMLTVDKVCHLLPPLGFMQMWMLRFCIPFSPVQIIIYICCLLYTSWISIYSWNFKIVFLLLQSIHDGSCIKI